jgi:hypothetical protein
MLTAIASFASFTAVLAESLAAIGLSALMPTLIASVGKQLKCAFEDFANDPANLEKALAPLREGLGSLNKMLATRDGEGLPVPSVMDVIESVLSSMARGSESIEAIDLLVPKSADLDASFEFHGNERYEGEAEVGAMVQLVTVKAGMSALYESTSSSKVSLKLHFESVPVNLRCGRGALDLVRNLVSALSAKKILVSDAADMAKIFAVKNRALLQAAISYVQELGDTPPADALAQVKTRLQIA